MNRFAEFVVGWVLVTGIVFLGLAVLFVAGIGLASVIVSFAAWSWASLYPPIVASEIFLAGRILLLISGFIATFLLLTTDVK